MADREFRVLKTLGGCGGTIVSRSLAACGAVVLSEVNPRAAQLFGEALNPHTQVLRNYPDLYPANWLGANALTLGKPEVFGRFMSDLVDQSDLPLIIRDYSYVDYIGTPFVWPTPEAPSLEAALQPFGSIRAVLLVRRPSASLRSLLRHGPLATTLSAEEYIRGHFAFLEKNPDTPILRFEDFIRDRDAWLRTLCAHLGIKYDPEWQNNLGRSPALTGNAHAISSSEIEDVDVSDPTSDLIPSNLQPRYQALLSLCGYG